MKFTGSRRLVWFGTSSILAITLYALYQTGAEALGTATTSIISIAGLVGGWSHIVNKADTAVTLGVRKP